MKTILALWILFYAITLPTLAELSTQDLEKIREIVKASETTLTSSIERVESTLTSRINKVESTLTSRIEKVESTLTSSIEKVESKVDATDTRLRTVETGVAELRGRSLGFGVLRDWIVTICAVGALLISIFAFVKVQPKATQPPQNTQKAVHQ